MRGVGVIFFHVVGFMQLCQRESQVSLSSRNSFCFHSWEVGRDTKSISFQSFVLIFETCFHSKASFLGSELRDMGCPGTADLSIQSTEFQLTL